METIATPQSVALQLLDILVRQDCTPLTAKSIHVRQLRDLFDLTRTDDFNAGKDFGIQKGWFSQLADSNIYIEMPGFLQVSDSPELRVLAHDLVDLIRNYGRPIMEGNLIERFGQQRRSIFNAVKEYALAMNWIEAVENDFYILTDIGRTK